MENLNLDSNANEIINKRRDYFSNVHQDKVSKIKNEYLYRVELIERDYTGVDNDDALNQKDKELKQANKDYYKKLEIARAEYDKNVELLYKNNGDKANENRNDNLKVADEQLSTNDKTMYENTVTSELKEMDKINTEMMRPVLNLEEIFHKEYYYTPGGMNIFITFMAKEYRTKNMKNRLGKLAKYWRNSANSKKEKTHFVRFNDSSETE